MEFVIDPPIATKVQKMKQRVRWHDTEITQRGIDQTRLVIDDQQSENPEFSFLVIGDTGSGPHRGHNPQRRVAELMLDQCRFLIHTGDVMYLTGSSEFYPENFIEPYREFLVGGNRHQQITYSQMVFNLPFLTVPGNHDYYDLPLLYGVLAQLTRPARRLLQSYLDLDIGLRGSCQGNTYAQAFLDYLMAVNSADLGKHLDRYYTAETDTGRALRYQTGQFTRLPNRYYTFRYGGIDFFALDSNTFNAPLPLPNTQEGNENRRRLQTLRADIDRQMFEVTKQLTQLAAQPPQEEEQLDDLNAKLEQLLELRKDIQKQLESHEATPIDTEQLEWLQQRLIASWQDRSVRGRVLFFHHPPYVTEATKWHQAQTIAVRYRLQQVLDGVASRLGGLNQGRALVDLVLNGHAHCLDYLQTLDTGHADSYMNWIVCGGSGYSLRRQRQEGPELPETFSASGDRIGSTIAKSLLYVGRHGQGSRKRRPYSCLRIDVRPGSPVKFVVHPLVAERFQRQWYNRTLEAVEL
jgi:3',5'-cyclic AMP phosphodiesterase CpdA